MLYEARICYDAMRAAERLDGIPESPIWDDVPEVWQIALMRRVAAVLLCHEEQGTWRAHDAWVRHVFRRDGWTYGPSLDPNTRQSPDLRLSAQCTSAERRRIQAFLDTAEGLLRGRGVLAIN